MMEFMMTLAVKDSGGDKDMLTMLAKMKEIVSPAGTIAPGAATNPMEMFNTMLETFTRMREVADDISPHKNDNDTDPLLASIPKLVETITEQHQLNKAERAARVTTRNVPGPAGGTARIPVVSAAPTPPPENLAMWQMILRQQSTRLVTFAAAKQDPDDVAAMAILFAPPNVKEALAIFFHRDDVAISADIFAEIPALAEHHEWVTDFIHAAQERLFPDEFADADEETGETGDGDTA